MPPLIDWPDTQPSPLETAIVTYADAEPIDWSYWGKVAAYVGSLFSAAVVGIVLAFWTHAT